MRNIFEEFKNTIGMLKCKRCNFVYESEKNYNNDTDRYKCPKCGFLYSRCFVLSLLDVKNNILSIEYKK